MKKRKLFEVSLINKAYSRVIQNTTRFYTSDTALEIGFNIVELEYSFDSAEVILLNETDRSLVTRELTRNGTGFTYELESDIIEHYGNWAAQLKLEKDEEVYISSPVGFSIENDLYNSRPPKLSEVNTWKNLRKIADGLISDIRDELESVAELLPEIESAEQERQSAELIRVENEKQRIENDDNRENDINYLANGLTELQIHVGYVEKGVLGLEADFENNKFTRIGDAEGRTPGASFDGFNMYGGRRRVNLADNGTVNAVFGEGGYTEDGSNGQVMVEQPVFYYKVVPLKTQPNADGHGQNLMKARYYVSDQPRAGFKVHPAFKDHNGKTRQKVYVSAYESTVFDTSEGVYLKLDEQVADFASDKLSSIANAKPASGVTQNLTRENARKLANNRGQGWHQQTLATASMSQLLFIIEYATFNSQSALGAGFVSDPNDDTTSARAKNTGSTQTLGNKSGSVEVEGVIFPTYRGEENLWGNIFSIVDGFTLEGKGVHNGWFALGDYQENGIDGSYKPFGFTIAKANGYVKYFGYSEDADFAFIPGATNGGANSALPVGDYLYQNNALDGFLVALFGGYWSRGVNAGLFHWTLSSAFSSRHRIIGARLVYAP